MERKEYSWLRNEMTPIFSGGGGGGGVWLGGWVVGWLGGRGEYSESFQKIYLSIARKLSQSIH